MKLIFGLITALAVTACSGQTDLQTQLSGKPPAERRQVLEDECLKEVGWEAIHHKRSGHIRRMKEICRAIAE